MKRHFVSLLSAMLLISVVISCKKSDEKSGSIGFSESSGFVKEGNSFNIPVVAEMNKNEVVSVKFTIECIGCEEDEDFKMIDFRELFFATSGVQYIPIVCYINSTFDGDRIVKITLTSTSKDYKITEAVYTLKLVDDENLVAIKKGDYAIGTGESINIPVKLSNAPEEDIEIKVSYDWNNSKETGDDISISNGGYIQFKAGETEKNFTLTCKSLAGNTEKSLELYISKRPKKYLIENNSVYVKLKAKPVTDINNLIGKYHLTGKYYREDPIVVNISSDGNGGINIYGLHYKQGTKDDIALNAKVDIANQKLIIEKRSWLTKGYTIKDESYDCYIAKYDGDTEHIVDIEPSISGDVLIRFDKLAFCYVKSGATESTIWTRHKELVLVKQK